MKEPKIISVTIERRKWDTSIVHALFNNGERKDVVHYYCDEIDFSESEFIGLTADEARELFHRKDIAYLRS